LLAIDRMGFRSLTAIALAAKGGPFRVDWPLDAAEVGRVFVAADSLRRT